MKNLTILLTFLYFISFSARAQFSFGVKVGANIDYLIPEKDHVGSLKLETTSGVGYHFGGFAKFKVSKKIFFIPELQFIHKKLIDGNGNDSGKLIANYIELPLLLSYTPVRVINFDIGPSINYAITSSYELLNDKSNDFLKKTDIGINAGVRVNITSSISIVGRYYHGLISNSKITFWNGPSSTIPPESSNFKNSTIEMSLAYAIR